MNRRAKTPRSRSPRVPQFPWFFPSFHGDLRLVPNEADASKTDMVIVKPTADEQRIVNEIGKACVAHGWLDTWEDLVPGVGFFARTEWRFTINAPIVALGPIVQALMRPGPAVLTAIKISDGRMETASGGPAELQAALGAAYREPPPPEPGRTLTVPDPKPVEPVAEKPADVVKPVAAATVRRPTPSCPQCVPGSIAPASEVLLTFLDDEQHERWARERTVLVDGGLSGHRYLLAHRHTERAQRQGRICYDLDDKAVVHFHDNAVPPEEEVLAALLILRHREPWLRNEATMFAAHRAEHVYKNPFGDITDGTLDASIMHSIGDAMRALRPH